MCGITGIVDLRERRPISREQLARMNDSIAHRGPDADGLHLEPGIGLGHRRLSIIDLASGQQPMYSPDRDVVLVYNGEIYNFQSLRRELIVAGHTFTTHCDTEVVLRAWLQWGAACVDHFNGMYAFALWQRSTETLFMARDRIGIKPLYYAMLDDGHLLFGSELKALLTHPALPRRLDPTAVEDYFSFGYVPDPKSILQDVYKLPPAHCLSVRRGQRLPSPHAYWDISFSEQPINETDAAGELIERLNAAVQSELMADVPLGAFLSGGVDSSAVVAMMAKDSSTPVNTCSISFDDKRFDEARFAAKVAERYRTDHHLERVDSEAFDLVDRLGQVYDEPYADSSAMPTFRVCELARRHVKVALSGDGGDENFAGYRRHRFSAYEGRVRALLPQALRAPVFGALGRHYPKFDWAPRFLRAKSTLEALALDPTEGYLHSVSITTPAQRERLFSSDFQHDLQGYRALEVFRRHAERAPTRDPLSLVQYLDFKTYLPGDILTKVDRASMAHSLEVRVPILNHEFVDWVSRMPPRFKLRGREGKYIFKKALEPYLPQDVLHRPKMGFSVPLAGWFRGPLAGRLRQAVLGSELAQAGICDLSELERLVTQHQRGTSDHAPLLWALLMFEGFHRRVLTGQAFADTAA